MSMMRTLFLALVVALGMTMVGVWSADASDPAKPGADDPRYLEGVAAFENKDFEEAYTIWIELAEAGNAAAQFKMGVGYHTGEYLEKDWKQAVRWYQLAGDQGDLDAMFNHGHLLYFRSHQPEHFFEAAQLFSIAAKRDHLDAQVSFGLMLLSGKGMRQDPQEGFKWLHLAMENGWTEAEDAFHRFGKIFGDSAIAEGKKRARRWRESHPRPRP